MTIASTTATDSGMKNTQGGYTLYELAYAVIGLVIVALIITILFKLAIRL